MSIARNLSTLTRLRTAPRASRAAIVRWQERRLRALVRHAYDNVTYYRDLFDRASLRPENIRTLADLHRIPVTAKTDIAGLPQEQVVATGVRGTDLVVRRTSGSSGPVFTMWRSPHEEFVSEMLQLRIRRYYGLRPFDRQVIAVMDTRTVKGASRLHRLANRLGLHQSFSVLPILPPDEFLKALVEIKPRVIIGFPGPLARVAQLMDATLRDVLRLRHVITTGEVLTSKMRQQISEGFDTRVYDKYVCAELGHIAYECHHTGALHTCDEHLIVEVVGKNGAPAADGERGELVGTALNYFAMPFIRYRLADSVVRGAEPCACGEPFSTVRSIQGRMIDYFYLPDGRVIHPYQLGGQVQHSVNWVKEFQLIQERRDLIVANIVPTERPSPEEVARVTAAVRPLLGPTVELQINFVEAIDWGVTGKHRLFRSRVRSEYDDVSWT